MSADDPTQIIADLTTPGILVAFYLSDGTTARARYPAGTIEDVETTLSLAKRTGKLIQVDEADSDTDHTMDIFIVPSHVVLVKIEKNSAGGLLGAVV